MKVWKVIEIIVNDDHALELRLNSLERKGAKIKEIILANKWETPAAMLYSYKIIYTEEDILEVPDESK